MASFGEAFFPKNIPFRLDQIFNFDSPLSARSGRCWHSGSSDTPLPPCNGILRRVTKLPLVIPILFYTEKRSPYPYSTNWLQEFDETELAGKLYGNACPLVDVTVIPDRSMAALTLLQKHIRQRRLLAVHSQLRNSSYLVALAALFLLPWNSPRHQDSQQSLQHLVIHYEVRSRNLKPSPRWHQYCLSWSDGQLHQ
jgi:hypothetical protein